MSFRWSFRSPLHAFVLAVALFAVSAPQAWALDDYLITIKSVKTGDMDAIRAQIVRGEDMNHQDDLGRTALAYAATAGNAPIIKLLLSGGARPGIKDVDGRVALHWAVQQDYQDAVAALLDGGAQIEALDPHGTTPLMMAAGNGNLAVVRLLIARHANLNLRDYTGRSALDIAEGARQPRAATLLRQAGAS